jgi:DNA mismatch endonuclease (patch repair protein)
MSKVRSKDTKPEILVRSTLHAAGFRFRLHRRDLPGTPDIVLPKYRAVVEVRGCFWHGHPGCGRTPKSNLEFWEPKLRRNRARDLENERLLHDLGWRTLVIWECAICGPSRLSPKDLIEKISQWIYSDLAALELGGDDYRAVGPAGG